MQLYLATERAQVLAMLADFCLLDLLTKTSTIPCAVLADNADLFGALGLQEDNETQVNNCVLVMQGMLGRKYATPDDNLRC